MEKKLTGKTFVDQVSRYGLFAEQFPDCFDSTTFANGLPELLPLIAIGKSQKSKKANTTAPTNLSTYKNDISRRTLSVPNPESFLRLAKYMAENWDDIFAVSKSSNSLSPITFIKSYHTAEELINCESIREHTKAKSDFISGIKSAIRASLGYKIQLKIDITNCYNSLYTHSITWAICGKEEAKSFFRASEPEALRPMYEMGDYLDCFTRQLKNNETNGIIVGPYTSRIVSEIILSRIDRCMRDKDFKFKRYVDDYKIYFRTEAKAQESLPIIEKILNEYNLTLNTSKTDIEKYPFNTISQIKDNYEKAKEQEGVFGVLNSAAILHKKGEKGAYKYALKYVMNEPIDINNLQIIIPTLVNIMLIDPRYGKYVTRYLKNNIKSINSESLSVVFNTELKSNLENDMEQESLLFAQLLRDLSLKIEASNIINILKSGNDFAIIIALDIWKNRKDLVTRSKAEAQKINDSIKDLMIKLTGEKLTGSRWLLLYELRIHELVKNDQIPDIEINAFFEKMIKMKISFYHSIVETEPTKSK